MILLWFSGPSHSGKCECMVKLTKGPRSAKECVGDEDEEKFMEKLYRKKGKIFILYTDTVKHFVKVVGIKK